mgnify:CR=1 FL=1
MKRYLLDQRKLQSEVLALNNALEEEVAKAVDMVKERADAVEGSAKAVADLSQSAHAQATTVASAAEEATINVQTVASAAEELSSSINEISSQVGRSSQIARQATEDADRTNAQIQGLAEAAQKIGEVVGIRCTRYKRFSGSRCTSLSPDSYTSKMPTSAV